MRIIRDLAQAQQDTGTILTIGAFDGIHLGHQAIMRGMARRAREQRLESGMVTFHPHPREVLSPGTEALLLTTLEEKIALVGQLDIDLMVIMRFDEALSQLSAREFVGALCSHLRMRELWIGHSFRLGRGGEGDAPRLTALGKQLGFDLHVVAAVGIDTELVSSTRIRALLGDGDVAEAAKALGRRYSLSGQVVHGAHRGRTLGFPTANLLPPPGKLVPADGVYVACATLAGISRQSVVNIGVRPSFDNGDRIIEAHLLDFDGDIYGQTLELAFIDLIRPERRFRSVDELVAEIQRDCDQARSVHCAIAPTEGGGSDWQEGLDVRTIDPSL